MQGAHLVHDKFSKRVHEGILNLSEVIPELKHMLCPIINTAYDIQCNEGINLLNNELTSDVGCWNAFLFVEGRTENFHSEDDCACTFITVPQ